MGARLHKSYLAEHDELCRPLAPFPPAPSTRNPDVAMKRQDQFAQVYHVVGLIPHGRVVTYGQIARHLGWPNGARTVGWAMRHCPACLPWHRVVGQASGHGPRGRLSARAADEGSMRQRMLLEDEGVAFDAHGRINLLQYGWDEI